jgi:hypothetical protein
MSELTKDTILALLKDKFKKEIVYTYVGDIVTPRAHRVSITLALLLASCAASLAHPPRSLLH